MPPAAAGPHRRGRALFGPAGRYQVGFYFPETMSELWVPKATVQSGAAWLTVNEGGTTVVNESLFPTGGLEITATGDAGPVQDFCLEAIGEHYLRSGCATAGTVLLTDLPVGTYLLSGTGIGSRTVWEFAEVAEDTVTSVALGA